MENRLLTSWTELREARIALLDEAQQDISIFARDLSGHALDTPLVHATLIAFFRRSRGNRLRVAAHAMDKVCSTHPRLMSLLRLFGHQMSLRESPRDLKHLPDQLLLVDAGHAVVHFQYDQARGKVIVDAEEEAQPYRRRFEELWSVCGPPISGTPLGL